MSLTLSAHLDETVLWQSHHETAAAPTWPHLQKLDVTLNIVSLSGEWYFDGLCPEDHEGDDPERGIIGGDGHTNYTNYREHADPTISDPFVNDLAKEVKNVPILEYLLITSELGHGKVNFHIDYYSPRQRAKWGDESDDDIGFGRVYYEVGKRWRPDGEVMKGLRWVGREKYCGEVIERFLESQY